MKRRNDRTNELIRWSVVAADILLLNLVLWVADRYDLWSDAWTQIWFCACNLALITSAILFPPIVHRRMVSAGHILKRIVQMTVLQAVLAYVIIKVAGYQEPVGRGLLEIGTAFAGLLILARFAERTCIKRFRSAGRNTRTVTFVGTDDELKTVYEQLISDQTTGYRFLGYFADQARDWQMEDFAPVWLGTVEQLIKGLKDGSIDIGDELYLCVSRREGALIRQLSKYCEMNCRRFYFVPVASEQQKVPLRREELEDLEIYTAVESPLLSVTNKAVKRLFDLVFSCIAIICLLPLLPIIAVVIKCQSPGPVFFRQARTGLDGRTFTMLKFRSMHVNDEADSLQATEDDPRKFPFGDWMRRTNIDELPQFWNVLIGDMSIVGPRPHMLAHTQFYSEQIDKFMIRHFVKPGLTGWAQVTGYRGETRELWQMEGRVKRDIWYMEHWTFWLDLRIIWKTVKAMFLSNNKNAC